MATVLLLNRRNEGVPTALRLAQQEGHIVKLYSSQDHGSCLQGSKNPAFIGNPKRMAEQYDLVLRTCPLGDRLLNDSDYLARVIQTILPLPVFDPLETKDAVRVTVEGWFVKGRWLPFFTLSIDELRMMDGERGVLTPGMGSGMLTLEEGPLTEKLLRPFTELFEKVTYEGPFSLEVYLGEEEAIWLSSIHPSYHYDHLPLTCELLRESLFTFLYQASLQEEYKPQSSKDVALGVRLSLHPWPLEVPCDHLTGRLDLEVPKEARPHVWLQDVAFSDDGEIKTAGCDGCLGFVTARGSDMQEARRRVYRTIGNIVKSKDVQYRSDIGSAFNDSVVELKRQGWLN